MNRYAGATTVKGGLGGKHLCSARAHAIEQGILTMLVLFNLAVFARNLQIAAIVNYVTVVVAWRGTVTTLQDVGRYDIVTAARFTAHSERKDTQVESIAVN